MKSDPQSAVSSFAAVNVPRYTSYPTAPNFTATTTAARYEGWLATLPTDATLSLYVHVPFCAELCLYCGCNTRAVRRREPVDRYLRTLTDEIGIAASHLGPRKVKHLHWGGGTPSMPLSPAVGADSVAASPSGARGGAPAPAPGARARA